jgi:hypothetical protein
MRINQRLSAAFHQNLIINPYDERVILDFLPGALN